MEKTYKKRIADIILQELLEAVGVVLTQAILERLIDCRTVRRRCMNR